MTSEHAYKAMDEGYKVKSHKWHSKEYCFKIDERYYYTSNDRASQQLVDGAMDSRFEPFELYGTIREPLTTFKIKDYL